MNLFILGMVCVPLGLMLNTQLRAEGKLLPTLKINREEDADGRTGLLSENWTAPF